MTAPYFVGAFVSFGGGPVDPGRPLFAYFRNCPTCEELMRHETRAVETPDGRALEIEVCGTCGVIGRVRRV